MELFTDLRYLKERKGSCGPKTRATTCRIEEFLQGRSARLDTDRAAGQFSPRSPYCCALSNRRVATLDFAQHFSDFRLDFLAAQFTTERVSHHIGQLNQAALVRVQRLHFEFLRRMKRGAAAFNCGFKGFLPRVAFQFGIVNEARHGRLMEQRVPGAQRQTRVQFARGRQIAVAHRSRFVDAKRRDFHFQCDPNSQSLRDAFWPQPVAVQLGVALAKSIEPQSIEPNFQTLNIFNRYKTRDENIGLTRSHRRPSRPIEASVENWHRGKSITNFHLHHKQLYQYLVRFTYLRMGEGCVNLDCESRRVLKLRKGGESDST